MSAATPNSRHDRALTIDQLLHLYDQPFVQAVYRTVLGRPADPEGLANYTRQLRSGTERAAVIVELAASAEARAKGLEVPGLREYVSMHPPRVPSLWLRIGRRLMHELLWPLRAELRAVDNAVHAMGYRIEQLQATLATGQQPGSRAPAWREEAATAVLANTLAAPAQHAALSATASVIAQRLGTALKQVRPSS